MRELASGTATSPALPSEFFARWVDHDSWAQWSPDTEWVTLDGPVAQGTRGTLKPTGGPKTRFEISTLTTDSEYTDTSKLPGATLVFQHTARREAETTILDALVTLSGPLAFVWARILGAGFRSSVQADLDRLVRLVEVSSRA